MQQWPKSFQYYSSQQFRNKLLTFSSPATTAQQPIEWPKTEKKSSHVLSVTLWHFMRNGGNIWWSQVSHQPSILTRHIFIHSLSGRSVVDDVMMTMHLHRMTHLSNWRVNFSTSRCVSIALQIKPNVFLMSITPSLHSSVLGFSTSQHDFEAFSRVKQPLSICK